MGWVEAHLACLVQRVCVCVCVCGDGGDECSVGVGSVNKCGDEGCYAKDKDNKDSVLYEEMPKK